MVNKIKDNKIVSIANRLLEKNKISRHVKEVSKPRIIAITSGKGGVGKTNIAVNLGFILSQSGKKVLVMDADLGLANLDMMLGLAPRYNLSHVINGEKTIREIILQGPSNMLILPAASGIQELTELSRENKIRLITELDSLVNEMDYFLIDTPAGISSNVMYFNISAKEIIVVVSPEPTSITDGYALMKVLSMKYKQKRFKLLVNMVFTPEEGQDVYRQLNLVAGRFLDITMEYAGYILHDTSITKCVKRQKILAETYSDSPAVKCLRSLSSRLIASEQNTFRDDGNKMLWRNVVQSKLD